MTNDSKPKKIRSFTWVAVPLALMLFYNNCAQQQGISLEEPSTQAAEVRGPASTPDTGWSPGTGSSSGGSTWSPGIVNDGSGTPSTGGTSGGSTSGGSSTPVQDGGLLSGVYEAKIGGTATKPVDIVWVIDNSASMTQEAAHVRSNFTQFINSVSKSTDLRVALISKAGGTGNAVSLPVTGPAYQQVNYMVRSTDSLSLTAAAMCPASGGPSVCGDTRLLTTSSIRGTLNGFLRQNSHKVFIFVTDDNSAYPRTDFMKIVAALFPSDAAVVFGFVAKSRTESPCLYSPGTEYIALAGETSGSIFNICDTDWTGTFSTLANNVISLASNTALLPASVMAARTFTVYIDNVLIPSAQYTVDAAGIHFSSAAIAGRSTYTLRIVYAY